MRIYDFPRGYERKSTEYIVKCNGVSIPVYSCDVSLEPFNRVWPGYQRSIEQTKKASFVMLSSDENTVLEICPVRKIEGVTVRPLSKKAETKIDGEKAFITFCGPGQYTVEFDNNPDVLTVFINPEKEFCVDKIDGKVIYFGPGVHYVDKRIVLNDGETVFIDEGAVVYGAIEAVNKTNVSVIGYGILDNSHMKRANEINGCAVLASDAGGMTGNPVFFNRCDNVLIDGITIVDSSGWSIFLDGCKNVIVDNIKLIGMWRYNADGCDFCNCTNAVIKNSFLRNFDDCITVKGFKLNNDMPVENILAENCVLWCDWGRALEVGAETSAPYMREIIFRNCDIISGSHIMMDVQHGDRADVSNVYFENIRVEYRAESKTPLIQKTDDEKYVNKNEEYMPALFEVVVGPTMWAIDDKSGNINNVYFKNISVMTENDRLPLNPRVYVRDGADRIDGVHFENITVNGEKCNMDTLMVNVGDGVKNFSWK